MAKVFFKLGTTDMSASVDIQNYDVNRVEVQDVWTDADWIEHRTTVRHRLQGRFSLGYRNAADFAAAVAAISAAKSTNGYASCTLRANNTGVTHTGDCYLTILGAASWDIANDRQWQTLTVDVYER